MNMQPHTLVIVEDNKLTREGLCDNIRWAEHGIRLEGAFANGRAALEFIRRSPPDVVLTDIVMPVLDGIALANALAAEQPGVKVVLISAYDEFCYARDALRAGVFDYVVKPFEYDALLETIKRALAQRDADKALSRDAEQARRTRRLKRLLLEDGSEEDALPREDDNAFYACAILRTDEGVPLPEALLEEWSESSVALSADTRALIMPLKDPQAWESALRALRQRLKNHPRIYAGLSKPVTGENQLRAAYLEALNALSHGFMDQSARVFAAGEKETAKRQTPFPSALEERYVAAVALGNLPDAERHTAELRTFLSDNAADGQYALTVAYAFAAKAALRVSPSQDTHAALFASLREAADADALFARLSEINRRLCGAASMLPAGRQCVLAAQQVIRARYVQESLNLKEIARAVSMSPAYLSTVYKRETGENLTDTLHRVRMERAKELLRTEARIGDVARSVGYSNPFYFSTAFKKHTGRTPSEYRDSPTP